MKLKMKECFDPDRTYTNSAHATWQFAHEMKQGDIVFAKKGRQWVVGRGIVESSYTYDPTRKEYRHVRRVQWTHKGTWECSLQLATKTLTDMTPYPDYLSMLNGFFENNDLNCPSYGPEDFLAQVYMDRQSYNRLVDLVTNKKNVILQGAPGTGKTYAAERLAYSIMGKKDTKRVMMVQFHQSYSYEDFVMGFRPSESGFELKKGAFYHFCKNAAADRENAYFFIIDEINRGNLSKIFGELFVLLESDKRGISMPLLYSPNEKFSVPENMHIIGMMNTADRSLAMLDYALRRRFAFYEMKPAFASDGFRNYRMNLNSPKFDQLINCVENLNTVIAADDALGEGFCIGHSYFCKLNEVTDQSLSEIVEYEIIPLLREYWFDEPAKVRDWSSNLRNALK